MADTQVLKCSNCNIVINEILSFVCNKIDVLDEDSLCRICVSSFSEEDITTAKSLLFDSVPTTKRKIQRKRDGKAKRDIDDIICLLKETDPERIPIFVSRDLQKLPPVLFDHLDCTKLLKELQLMKNEIKELKEAKEQLVTIQQLESIRNDIEQIKSSGIKVPQNESKRVDCMVNNELDDSDSYDTIISAPSSPLLNSSRAEGKAEKVIEDRNEPTRNGRSVPVLNIMTHRADACALSADALAPVRVTTVGHTAVSNGDQDGQQLTFANVVRNVTSSGNDGWTVVQRKYRKQRFTGNKGKAVIKPDEKFKAAEIMIPLYISNVSKGLSSDDIVKYIKDKCNLLVKVEKIIMKIEKEYDSYKIYIPKYQVDILMQDDVWPAGVSYRRFINFRRQRRSKGSENNQNQ